jgi:hypothetical protein
MIFPMTAATRAGPGLAAGEGTLPRARRPCESDAAAANPLKNPLPSPPDAGTASRLPQETICRSAGRRAWPKPEMAALHTRDARNRCSKEPGPSPLKARNSKTLARQIRSRLQWPPCRHHRASSASIAPVTALAADGTVNRTAENSSAASPLQYTAVTCRHCKAMAWYWRNTAASFPIALKRSCAGNAVRHASATHPGCCARPVLLPGVPA